MRIRPFFFGIEDSTVSLPVLGNFPMDAVLSSHPTDQILSSYGLGKLDDGSAEAVNKHLEACSDCRKRVAEMSADSFLGRVREAQAADKSILGQSQGGGTESLKHANAAPPPSADTLPPGLADHPDYQVLRELGRGGMGVVYLAENKLMERKEVLKVVSSHLLNRKGVLERFLREIRFAAQLHHPNIVTAYSTTRVGESIVFSMQFVEGYDLSQLVEKSGPLSVPLACNFVYQAALGLQHAHEHGMVHRDIKPSNLMLARHGDKPVVKVLDFGLAKVTSESAVEGGLTHEGQMLGTPDFIAPEQIRDAQSAGIQADIYSLGCTLYYLLTAGPPFQGSCLYDILQAHHSMDARPLNFVRPEVPVELAAVVGKMMAKEPDRRFREPKEVAHALTPFFKKGSVASVGSKPALSPVGHPGAKPGRISAVSVPTRSATEIAPAPASAVREPSDPTRQGSILEGLIDLRETDRLFDTMLNTPGPAATSELIQRGHLAWTTAVEKLSGLGPRGRWAAAGVLLIGLAVVCAAVIIKTKTKDGVIMLEELPKDAVVFLDRERIAVTWPGGGKTAEITVHAGRHELQVRRNGFKMFGEEVSIEAGHQKRIRVSLEPLVTPGSTSAAADPANKPSDTGGQTPKTITNSIGMRYTLIPAGEFLMGSPDDDKRAPGREKPQHRVRITQPFYLGVTEVTRGQFRKFVDATGYRTEAEQDGRGGGSWNNETDRWEHNPKFTWLTPGGFEQTDEHPVVHVSWNDAVAFTDWLSRKEHKTYRLPTEAEWEYACLAGSPPPRPVSDDTNAPGEYVSHINSPTRSTYPVDQMKPNAWGLHGMLGNVQEWCADRYAGNSYTSSPAVDPTGAAQGSAHVHRGSDWWGNGPLECRPAYRNGAESMNDTTGFRVALELSPAAPDLAGQGFVPLFNGKDLTGWVTHPGQPGHWRVENGILIGSGAEWSSLWTVRKSYRDFHLRVEARINERGDSGVFFRWLEPQGGYQAQILGYPAGTGSLIYSRTGKTDVHSRESLVAPGHWFVLDVIADGDHIVINVNGKTTADYTDAQRSLSSGSLGIEQRLPATVIEFRRIDVKELNRG